MNDVLPSSISSYLSERLDPLLLAGIIFELLPVMRSFFLIAVSLALTGCSGKNLPQTVGRAHLYADSASSSLAFSPPIAQNEPPILLPREARQPGVFIGFDDVSASYFYIRTDDRMTNDGTDHYVRRSIIEKVGVSYR